VFFDDFVIKSEINIETFQEMFIIGICDLADKISLFGSKNVKDLQKNNSKEYHFLEIENSSFQKSQKGVVDEVL
jgi:hypothetical protein